MQLYHLPWTSWLLVPITKCVTSSLSGGRLSYLCSTRYSLERTAMRPYMCIYMYVENVTLIRFMIYIPKLAINIDHVYSTY